MNFQTVKRTNLPIDRTTKSVLNSGLYLSYPRLDKAFFVRAAKFIVADCIISVAKLYAVVNIKVVLRGYNKMIIMIF